MVLISVSLILSVFITIEGLTLARAAYPLSTDIDQLVVSDDKQWLTVTAHSAPVVHCVRQSQHLLYQDNPGQLREYIPIGSSLNGASLQGSVWRYKLRLMLPPNLTGTWYYLNRSHFECPPFGLVRGDWTTWPPMPVDFGDGSVVTAD